MRPSSIPGSIQAVGSVSSRETSESANSVAQLPRRNKRSPRSWRKSRTRQFLNRSCPVPVRACRRRIVFRFERCFGLRRSRVAAATVGHCGSPSLFLQTMSARSYGIDQCQLRPAHDSDAVEQASSLLGILHWSVDVEASIVRAADEMDRAVDAQPSAFDRLKRRFCRSETSAVLPQIPADFLWCDPYRLHCPLQSRRFDAERLCPLLQFTLLTGGLFIRFLLRLKLVANPGHSSSCKSSHPRKVDLPRL